MTKKITKTKEKLDSFRWIPAAIKQMIFTLLLLATICVGAEAQITPKLDYTFAVVGCNRVDYTDTIATTGTFNSTGKSTANVYQLKRLFTEISQLQPLPKYLFMTGDIVMGYIADTVALATQLSNWKLIYQQHPLSSMGIQLVVIPGNHETQNKAAGKKSFIAAERTFMREMAPYIIGNNGPTIGGLDNLATDQSRLTYSFNNGCDHFIVIDTDPVGQDSRVPYHWIANDIKAARAANARHIFALGHKPAYSSPLKPLDGLEAFVPERDSLWKYLEYYQCEAMFAAHEHLWDTIHPHEGKTWQVIAGNGGSRVESSWLGAGQSYFGFTLVSLYANNQINVKSLGHDADMTKLSLNEDDKPTTLRADFNMGINPIIDHNALTDQDNYGPFTINASISDDIAVTGAQLNYSVNGFVQSPVTGSVSNSQYVFIIPAQSNPGTIQYNIQATDASAIKFYSTECADAFHKFTFGLKGPSSSQGPYLLPTTPGAYFTSILTTTDVVGGYKMAGTPDGLGAFDNGDSTFTLLMNHEFVNTVGAVHAHGSKGAFVSKWVINKSDLSVVSGADLIKNVNLWNGSGYTTYNASNPSPLTAFSRFCSADLPAVSAFYNSATGMGTQERIFMNGEEAGSEGRAFAHIVTGVNAGTSYELPYMGKLSFENSLANPVSSDKTIVAGNDDSTPGQVYFYVGTKTNSGSEIDKAGLTNGKLFGVSVSGLFTETSASVPVAGTAFSLVDLGVVQNITGATLNTNSNNAGVTTFLRPEDGAWDPSHPNDYYFATTNAFTSPSRLWQLHFTDIDHPEMGGTITAMLDGTEGQKMFDNMAIDTHGHVILLEDVGNNPHVGKVWQYTIATDSLKQVGVHDPSRFLAGGANFLTQDEESSGIIDVQDILGRGKFLVDVQAHFAIPDDAVEGGQLLAYYNPDTKCSFYASNISGPANACAYSGSTGSVATYTINTNDASDLVWSVPAKATLVSGQGTNTIKVKYLSSFVSGTISVKAWSDCTDDSVARSISINKTKPAMPGAINGPNSVCSFVGKYSLVTYSIEPVAEANSYQWTVPADVKIINGQGTTSVQVIFEIGFVSSLIKVKAISACGSSINSSIKLTADVPNATGPIMGQNYGVCSPLNTVIYTVNPVKFASTYNWSTTIEGATIVATSNTATITFPPFVTGLVSVSAVNNCGSSAVKNIRVYAAPATPVNIEGENHVCSGSVYTYYADSVAGALSYNWTVPQGSVIQSGAGTQTISVLIGNASGDIKVRAANACGMSAIRRLPIVTENCSALRTASNSISVYPVPTDKSVKISFFTSHTESYQVYVTDIITGAVVFKSNAISIAGDNVVTADLEFLNNGYYFIHLVSSSLNYHDRIEIRK